ncbi:unnamed protein product [Adineta ricciae]|uniref:Uncharacterized protein n=1 Tax=Adineta ricciae TaxID=249248 RepID=A0A816FNX8_ADIRI|nr:unnamed protein product [Adineta ricciae]
MRKLFLEADPDTSSTMKLESLLAKVLPNYRLDLLKQKAKDPDEFQQMARDLEHTYLVLNAIEQNVQSNGSFSGVSSTSSTSYYNSSFQPHQRPSFTPSPRYGPRSNNASSYFSQPVPFAHVSRFPSPSSSNSPSRSFQPRANRGSFNRRFSTPRQNLSVFQPSSSPSSTFPPSPTPMFPSSSSSDVLPPLMSLPDTTSTPSPSTDPPSSIVTPTISCQLCSNLVSDGTASHVSAFHPSKPFLLYATLFVNNTLLHTLIDTGASATCVNLQVLQQLSNVRYADRQSRSFLLADGVLPLSSTGLVELSININNTCIPFYALTAEKLCVDLILGMDFMIVFHAIIDIHSQQLSINVDNQRLIIPIDDPIRRPLVPIRAARFTCILPQSSVNVMILCPISCLSAYFLPAS